MALPQVSKYTVEDIYNLPEETRTERLNGQIYYKATPSRTHQKILNYLNTEINLFIRSKGCACEVYSTPFAVFLNENNAEYVEPDISVICSPNMLTDKGCIGAPDWIIEIVSLDSKRMDYYFKLFKYHDNGVREYWIVDADKNRITVYNFQSEDIIEYTFQDNVKVNIYDDFTIDFSQLRI